MPFLLDSAKGSLRSLLDRIQAAAYTPLAPLDVEAWVTPEPVPYAGRETGMHVRLKPGDQWGEL